MSDIEKIEKSYGIDIVPVQVNNDTDFFEKLESIEKSNMDVDLVIIYTHADEDVFFFTNPDKRDDKTQGQYLRTDELHNLDGIKINYFVSIGCNTGATDPENRKCMAEEILNQLPMFSNVVAANRQVTHSGGNGEHHLETKLLRSKSDFPNWIMGNPKGYGFYLFPQESDKEYLGYEYNDIVDLLEAANFSTKNQKE